jgi:hypothetical protein
MFYRPVKRLNENVEMGNYIKELGFYFEDEQYTNKKKIYYINDLLPDEPFNFMGPGKLFLFFPFKCYTRPLNKGEKPIYGPAVASFEYFFTPDQNEFPIFKRRAHFTSLFRKNLILKK